MASKLTCLVFPTYGIFPHARSADETSRQVHERFMRIPMIVTDDSGIVTAQSGHRDRCRVVRDIACQANCTIA